MFLKPPHITPLGLEECNPSFSLDYSLNIRKRFREHNYHELQAITVLSQILITTDETVFN